MSKILDKVIVIFPTKNVSETIEHVINTARKSRFMPEVLVVDSYSSDDTSDKAKNWVPL